MGAFRDAYEEFQKANTEVLGISIDPWPAAGVFAKSLKLPFPVLSDWPQNEVIKAYDVWHPERYTARRTTFVIDKQGVIRGVVESETDMTVHSRDSLRIVQELEGART